MAIQISAIDEILKKIIQPAIEDQLENKTLLLSQLRKNQETADTINSKIYITVRYSRNAGIKSIATGGALPTAGAQKYKQAYAAPKYTFGRFIVEDQALEAAKNNVLALTNLLTSESDGLSTDMAKDLNRQLFGDGTGQLCLLKGAITAAQTTIQVDTPGSQFIYVDSLITVGAKAAKKVTAVLSDTTVKFATAPGATADNSVIRKSASTSEMMGLKGIVDDGGIVATLENITRSVNSWWSAITEETSAALTTTYMQGAYTAAEKYDKPDFAVTTFSLRDKLAALMTSIRVINDTLTLTGGFKGLAWNDIAVIADMDTTVGPNSVAKQGYMYFLNLSSLSLETLAPLSWMERDGQILKYVAGYPQYDAIMRYYGNLVTNNVRKNTALSNKIGV
jgi:hypothetical protein